MTSKFPTPRFRRYHSLMPHRMQEVLLVSTDYQAYVLQEDGDIEEQVFAEFKALSLSSAPSFTHVNTGAEAIEALQARRFDLVLAANHLPDMTLSDFGKRVRGLFPRQKQVILAFHDHDRDYLKSLVNPATFDAVFSWSGDARILLAIIKTIEDRINVDSDIADADVRVILLVEESFTQASTFLSALYPVLMRQSQSLFSEGLNRSQKLTRMRTRPKVLHAFSEQQAVELIEKYSENLIAVISEMGFSSEGEHNPEAGIRLAGQIRKICGDLPVLLQSGHDEPLQKAKEAGFVTVNRKSPNLVREIRGFLTHHLGFGDFVFRTPEGIEICRARNSFELGRLLPTVPDDSLHYHVSRNHFSDWLMARSEFSLARKLKKVTVDDFTDLEGARNFLVKEFESLHRRQRTGVIRDVDPSSLDPDSLFQRLGNGSLGGKARSVAFLDQLLSDEGGENPYGMPLKIPSSFALTTEAFREFVDINNLYELSSGEFSDEEILERFLSGRLPELASRSLAGIVDMLKKPLAVRSSSLLEDNLLHPFAGIYRTAMLPNNSPDKKTRLFELEQSVKYVFAGTYFQNAREYIANTSRSTSDEAMGVLIQELVGREYNGLFYPTFAGVAKSYNYYPVAPAGSEDGVAHLVMGLGTAVAEGCRSLRFCPKHPNRVPGFGNIRQILNASQNVFFALDLSARIDPDNSRFDLNPSSHPIEDAENTEPMKAVGSIYDFANERIVEDPGLKGRSLVTFNNILLHRSIPLAETLDSLLELCTKALGTHVEIELACDLGDWRRKRAADEKDLPALHVLQLRPAAVMDVAADPRMKNVSPERIFCRSAMALGHGRYENIMDIVYVRRDTFEPSKSPLIAAEVGAINRKLAEEKRRYILLGPGRWGSADSWLGIPVQWGQISKAAIIVEASPADFRVDPSQGSHFFHNITALGTGYLTVPPGAMKSAPAEDGFVDWDWLDARPAHEESVFLRHIRLESPLDAYINGREGLGIAAWT